MADLSIDPRYVDVDFTTEVPYTFGAIPGALFAATPQIYEDAVGVIPESQWPSEIEKIDGSGWMENVMRTIMNQGNEGSCVSFATAQAFEINQGIQHGVDKIIPLSPMSLYKRIGRTAQSGSMLSDALAEIKSRGILPLDTPENNARFVHTHPATGFSRSLPSGWETTGRQFIALEWFDIRTLAGLISALLRFTPVVVGRDGHSICYARPFYRNSSLAVLYANSWGNWGQGLGKFTSGFGVDTLSKIKASAQWAFAIRSVQVPS